MAMLDPPVEWVPGDRRWTILYGTVQVVLWALLVSDAAVYLVFFGWPGLLSPFSAWPFGNPDAWQSGLGFLSPGLFLALGASWQLAGRYPVLGRIGISPIGLTIPGTFRNDTVPWPRVTWRDPVHLDVRGRRGALRITLTPEQAARVRGFLDHA
ncbi:MAG TPA: hypothetical protein VMH78_06395 [Thermoplasmata archaeon]|nr:hypothetical protein [Thermoplasmata archaeon]